MAIDFTKYPICDTDIWVNICLGRVSDHVFSRYGKLLMADVVEHEILKWYENDKFTFIASDFDKYKQSGSIFVIDHILHIPTQERLMLEQMLYELGFKHGFKNAQKHKGEYASAIYADHFGCTFMASNDNAFQNGGEGIQDFDGILVKNWNEVVQDIGLEHKDRIRANKFVEHERKRMNQHYENTKKDRMMDAKLKALQEMFSKR
jgi:hypothetical protein